MVAPAKKKDAIDLIEMMNKSWGADGVISEMNLARIKRKFARIEKDIIDDALRMALKGMVACCEHNIEDVHTFHQRSMAISGAEEQYVVNYSKSLQRLGLYFDDLQLLQTAYDADHGLRSVLRALIAALLNLGMMKKAMELLNELNDEEVEKLDFNPLNFESSIEFIEKHCISENEMLKYGKAIDDVMNQFGVISTSRKMIPMEVPGDSSFLEILVSVRDSAEKVLNMGLEICNKLAESPSLDDMSLRVSVRFKRA